MASGFTGSELLRVSATNGYTLEGTSFPSPEVGSTSLLDAYQIKQGRWSAGTATLTLRDGQTNYWTAGCWITVSGITPQTGYNGFYKLTAATSTTASFALASDPGSFDAGDFGLASLNPEVQLVARAPFQSVMVLVANPDAVSLGQDAGKPILAVVGPGGNFSNYSVIFGCDGHSVSWRCASEVKTYLNGFVTTVYSGHVFGWTSGTDASSGGYVTDTRIARDSAGVVAIKDASNNVGAIKAGVIFPSSDPHRAGEWWDNAGTLTRSAG